MKIFNTILKILLSLLLISPILGAFGIFPAPTPDLYNTPEAFSFIEILFTAKYVTYMIAIVFMLCLILIVKNKMAIVALLLLPITLNIIGFHLFLDGGLFTAGAIMANVLFLLNLYFLWQNRKVYNVLWNS